MWFSTWCVLSVQSFIITSQFSSVAQSCPTLCDPMNCSTPGLPVHHQLPEFTQIHVHRVSDAIQPSHPLLSPSPAPNPSQHQSLFQWVNSSHEVSIYHIGFKPSICIPLHRDAYRWWMNFLKCLEHPVSCQTHSRCTIYSLNMYLFISEAKFHGPCYNSKPRSNTY